jgi:hypothetical protein
MSQLPEEKFQALNLQGNLMLVSWRSNILIIWRKQVWLPIGNINSWRTLRKGKQKLRMWPNCEGDGSVNNKTPGKSKSTSKIDTLERVTLGLSFNSSRLHRSERSMTEMKFRRWTG